MSASVLATGRAFSSQRALEIILEHIEAPVRACKKLSLIFQNFLTENEPGKFRS